MKIIKGILLALTAALIGFAVYAQITVSGENLLSYPTRWGFFLARSYRWFTIGAVGMLSLCILVFVCSHLRKKHKSKHAKEEIPQPQSSERSADAPPSISLTEVEAPKAQPEEAPAKPVAMEETVEPNPAGAPQDSSKQMPEPISTGPSASALERPQALEESDAEQETKPPQAVEEQQAGPAVAAPTAADTRVPAAQPECKEENQSIVQEQQRFTAETEAVPPASQREAKPKPEASAQNVPLEAKFCKKCGTPREPGAKFCKKCGTRF